MTASKPSPIAPADLPDLIKPGETIVVAQATGEPLSLTRALVAERRRMAGARVFLGFTVSDTFQPEHADALSFASYGAVGKTARLGKSGVLDVVPCHYSQLPRLFASGALKADVVLLQLSPPGEDGRMTFGVANDYVRLAARHARCVIGEINPQAPAIFGNEMPHDFRIDHVVAGHTMLEMPSGHAGEVEKQIAAHVAARVPDGATIEMGVGAVPDAVLAALSDHRDLGIHSGMIGDRVLDLIEKGAVTNARKPFDRGVTIGTAIWGTKRLNAFAHRNRALRLEPSTYTQRFQVLAQIPRFTAINSAIEVDLTGQVNAEIADGRYVGAIGGQGDFVRGANAAEGGRSIIALPATAKGGSISRIVAALSGGVVTTPRSDADIVVTEYGVAELRGRTLAERTRRMIAIAAPQFRDTLARAAHDVLRRSGP
jgi:acyl-CoA hydrolase